MADKSNLLMFAQLVQLIVKVFTVDPEALIYWNISLIVFSVGSINPKFKFS